jgi:hypothetical protein
LPDGRCAAAAHTVVTPAHIQRGKEQLMKAFYLLAPLGAAALVAGCAYDPVYTTAPAPTAYVASTPAYVVPNTVVMGAPAIVDSDGDGYANHVDRWPYDSRFH